MQRIREITSSRTHAAQCEYSRGSATDGLLHTKDGSSRVNPNGNRTVPYLNDWNGKRNLNLNDWDDDWNANYRFLAVRNSLP